MTLIQTHIMRTLFPYFTICLFVLAACSGESSSAQSDSQAKAVSGQEAVWNIHPQWEWTGDRLAYYIRQGEKARVVTVRSDGTEVLELELGPGYHANPTYSARSGQLAFSSAPEGMNGKWDIWVVNPDGSEPTLLLDTPEREMHPAWDTAGIMIAFVRMVDGKSDIYIVNSRNGMVRQLTDSEGNEFHPKWSNEGNRLYYDKTTGDKSEICTLDIISRREYCFVSIQGMKVRTPAPTRAGDRIVFAMSDGEETTDLWEIEVETGELLQITDTPMESESAPFFSPDGRQIAFHSDAGGMHHVYVMNRNGSNRRKISK